jgi:hypothetical protein
MVLVVLRNLLLAAIVLASSSCQFLPQAYITEYTDDIQLHSDDDEAPFRKNLRVRYSALRDSSAAFTLRAYGFDSILFPIDFLISPLLLIGKGDVSVSGGIFGVALSALPFVSVVDAGGWEPGRRLFDDRIAQLVVLHGQQAILDAAMEGEGALKSQVKELLEEALPSLHVLDAELATESARQR